MSAQHFAEVILPFHLKGSFTYAVPEAMLDTIAPGKRVLVSFGKAHLYTGVVHELHDRSPEFRAKQIMEILDEEPLFGEQERLLWGWIASYYLCSLGEVFQAACPSGLKFSSNTMLSLLPSLPDSPNSLGKTNQSLVNYLLQNGDTKVSKLSKEIGVKSLARSIKELKATGFIHSYEKLQRSYTKKTEKIIRIEPDKIDLNLINSRARKQRETIEFLVNEHMQGVRVWRKKDLEKKLKIGSAVIKSLAEKSLIDLSEEKISRIPKYAIKKDIPELSADQQKAYKKINSNWKEHGVQLLFGVTSSGKTEVYSRLIEDHLKKEDQVLYMLPEIGLTSQLVHRLSAYFGDTLAFFHSRLSDNEQVEIWQAVRKGNIKVILGTRSSIFLPFKQLGLIIVDEEHDPSYKQQDPAPRYHARDLAAYLASSRNIRVLLGTATPSAESYYNAKNGKYALVRLQKRFGDWKMPQIHVADMKEEYHKKRNKGSLSKALFDGIQGSLEKGEQVMLFQNRRGFSPYVQCEDCGDIPDCPNCDISLTYHKYKNRLNCHYCGHSTEISSSCRKCGSKKIKTKGIGTEKLEEELSILFPDARIARMDLDTTRGKRAFEKISSSMQKGETDILVGTQMLTKGFDFANIGLAGVINADNLMFFPDFRAFERSFQLLTQISGRAGRRSDKAKVIIQCFQTDTDVILRLKNNQVDEFMDSQLAERSAFNYPPYRRLIEVILMHRVNKELVNAAHKLKKVCDFESNVQVLGPEFETVQRLRNWYRMKMIIKYNPAQHLQVKNDLLTTLDTFKQLSGTSSVRLLINVDPL